MPPVPDIPWAVKRGWELLVLAMLTSQTGGIVGKLIEGQVALPPWLPAALFSLAGTLALSGVVCCVWGWWRYPLVMAASFGDGFYPIHPLIRQLLLLLFTLTGCGFGLLLADPDQPLSRLQRWVYSYVALIYHAEAFYMLLFFNPRKHPATAGYLEALLWVVGWVLFPVLWPLVLAQELRLRQQRQPERFEPAGQEEEPWDIFD